MRVFCYLMAFLSALTSISLTLYKPEVFNVNGVECILWLILAKMEERK